METSTGNYRSTETVSTMPLDIIEERARSNVHDLNLRSPYGTSSIRFWMPVDNRFSVGENAKVRFVLNSRSTNKTRYPDVQFTILEKTMTIEDYFQQTKLIDFNVVADVLIIPRLVEVSAQNEVQRYYLEAQHRSKDGRLELNYPNTSDSAAFLDGIILTKITASTVF